MNSWCESCARKNLCYVVDDRPKCFVPITNTASGTPYLVGISSISRDNHEIAKDEPQTCSVNGRPYSECGSCEHFKCTADEPQIQLTARCLNCNNAKACKEKHWSGCIYKPIEDEPQTDCPWK